MIKILSIGNSFSQDATRYLYGIARADGVEMKVVNLYIGGCTLSRHYRNMMADAKEYAFEINGMQNTGMKVSIKEALLSDDWDVVTLQQQSANSAHRESFEPYFASLMGYVKELAPKARILLHETWGYPDGSPKLEKNGFSDHEEMYRLVRQTCRAVAEEHRVDGILSSGEVVLEANRRGAPHIYRDYLHMSYGFGRYLLGLCWYAGLTGRSVEQNAFRDFDEPISDEEIALASSIISLCNNLSK